MPDPLPAAPPPRDLRWSEETRLRHIDAAAFWEGRVNRADLMRRFGISVPQATNDLREYQRRAPGNLRYDTREKAYVTAPGFQPLFGAPSAEAWLAAAGENGTAAVETAAAAAGTAAAAAVPVVPLPTPARRLDPWLLRQVLAARRAGLALRVLYQPMDEPEPGWRWISPAALGSDGLRWHLRAWNHDAARFEDLLFPRMLALDGERLAGNLPADADWERLVAVHLRPAARLSPGQRRVIEADYGMIEGEVVVPVRAALLFLFLRRQGLDRPGGLVEIANRDAVEAVQQEIDARFAATRSRAAGLARG